MRQVRGLQDGPAIPKPRRALPTAGRSRSRRRPVGKTASRSDRTRQSPPASSRVSSRRYKEKRGRRSEARRGGKECVSTWRSRWEQDHSKKKKTSKNKKKQH